MPISLQPPLLSVDMPSWYYDGVTAKTRNLGTLGGVVQLGDGTTVASFPTQVFPHGMSFDGGTDYLLRAETAGELTFTDPAPFSVEALVNRQPVAVGGIDTIFCKNGGGAASSTPYVLYVLNNAGTMRVFWGSMNSAGVARGISDPLGSYWPSDVVAHVVGVFDGTTWILYVNAVRAFSSVALGCHAPDVANSPLYIGAAKLGGAAIGSYLTGSTYNAAVYPFALQPGEIGQLAAMRRSMIQRGF